MAEKNILPASYQMILRTCLWRTAEALFAGRLVSLCIREKKIYVFSRVRHALKALLISICSRGLEEPCRLRASGNFLYYTVGPTAHLEYIFGLYERCTASALHRLLPSCDIFIDGGAHIGYFTVLAAHRSPTIKCVAFEPTVEAFRVLEKNTRTLSTAVVREQKALGETDGEQFLYINKEYGTRNSLLCDEKTTEKRLVAVCTLDSYFSDTAGKRILLKLDCEGGEPSALRGARRMIERNSVTLIIEYRPECDAIITELCAHFGYHIYALCRTGPQRARLSLIMPETNILLSLEDL